VIDQAEGLRHIDEPRAVFVRFDWRDVQPICAPSSRHRAPRPKNRNPLFRRRSLYQAIDCFDGVMLIQELEEAQRMARFRFTCSLVTEMSVAVGMAVVLGIVVPAQPDRLFRSPT